MKKIIASLTFILSINLISYPTFAKTIPNIHTETRLTIHNTGTTPHSRNNAIRWRYKKKKRKLYKRLYNYTAKKWIGKWVPM